MTDNELPPDRARALMLLPAVPGDGTIDPETVMRLGHRRRSRRRVLLASSALAGSLTILTGTVYAIHLIDGPRETNAARATFPAVSPPTGPVSYSSCGYPNLNVQPLPPGTTLAHTAAQALQTAKDIGPHDNITVAARLVTDPVANKVLLGPADVPRVMWVLDGTYTVHRDPNSNVPYTADSPKDGTVERVVTLVDDATLTLGGNFSCGIVSSPTPGVRATTAPAAHSPGSPLSIVGTWRPATMAGVTTGLPAATADNDVTFFARSWSATDGGCSHDSAGYEIGLDGAFSTTTPVVNDLLGCTGQSGTAPARLPTADRLSRARFVTIDAQFLTFTDSAGHLLAAFSRVS